MFLPNVQGLVGSVGFGLRMMLEIESGLYAVLSGAEVAC